MTCGQRAQANRGLPRQRSSTRHVGRDSARSSAFTSRAFDGRSRPCERNGSGNAVGATISKDSVWKNGFTTRTSSSRCSATFSTPSVCARPPAGRAPIWSSGERHNRVVRSRGGRSENTPRPVAGGVEELDGLLTSQVGRQPPHNAADTSPSTIRCRTVLCHPPNYIMRTFCSPISASDSKGLPARMRRCCLPIAERSRRSSDTTSVASRWYGAG